MGTGSWVFVRRFVFRFSITRTLEPPLAIRRWAIMSRSSPKIFSMFAGGRIVSLSLLSGLKKKSLPIVLGFECTCGA